MIKIKGLKDFGMWLKKDQIVSVDNNRAIDVCAKGYAKFIGFDETQKKKEWNNAVMNERIKILEKYKIPFKTNYSYLQLIKILERIENEKTRQG